MTQLTTRCAERSLLDLGLIDDDAHALWKGGPALHPEVRERLGAWRDQLRSMPAPPTIDDMLKAKARENARRRVDHGASFPEPLYCTEDQIATAVLGPGHLREWREPAPMLERDGLAFDRCAYGRQIPTGSEKIFRTAQRDCGRRRSAAIRWRGKLQVQNPEEGKAPGIVRQTRKNGNRVVYWAVVTDPYRPLRRGGVCVAATGWLRTGIADVSHDAAWFFGRRRPRQTPQQHECGGPSGNS
jgi:hypothetical protein